MLFILSAKTEEGYYGTDIKCENFKELFDKIENLCDSEQLFKVEEISIRVKE